MITTMFFILVPFLKRAPCIIIHLARNAEKGGGVLMSIILPNLNHSFVPVPVPVPFPDSGFSIRPPRIPQFIFRKIHTERKIRSTEQISSRFYVSEQNFEQNKRFLRALPAGRISHFTSRIYPSPVAGEPGNKMAASCQNLLYRGYYMPARGYEFYLRVFNSISHE